MNTSVIHIVVRGVIPFYETIYQNHRLWNHPPRNQKHIQNRQQRHLVRAITCLKSTTNTLQQDLQILF